MNYIQYEIDWDDPDPTGRIVDYCNLAFDKSPNKNEISIGSVAFSTRRVCWWPPWWNVRRSEMASRQSNEYPAGPYGTRLFDRCVTPKERKMVIGLLTADLSDEDDIAIDTLVLFMQGNHEGSELEKTGGMRYHEGIVTGLKIIDGVSVAQGVTQKDQMMENVSHILAIPLSLKIVRSVRP
eukprot:gene10664-19414_t